jgi:NAD(P)-dependent dehydrogenase (short-subunit alcohol dehydrogenase family)
VRAARKDKDLAALDAIDNVTAVKLDVTRQDQVDAVVAMIREKDTGLYALVNNAGVGGGVVVPNAEEQEFTIRTKVNELVQLNQWGPYSYSRDQLVELLDEALSGDAPSE